MKRTRIKAVVTVPTRRKATQDVFATEITSSIQHNEKNKNIPDNTYISSPKISEDVFQEKQVSESLKTKEQIQNEELHIDYQSDEHKDNSAQNFEESKKEIIQSPETLNITEISSTIKLPQNRCNFLKPTPKFDSVNRVKRNSIQGSGASTNESEDDIKRLSSTSVNHIRNDLVQSVQGTKDASANNVKNNLTTSKVGQKRRILVSESAKKLAEARREFHLKHENKTPDKNKLTMYDLIYYNPVSNPMKKSKESVMTTTKLLDSQSEEFQEEENVDDPSSAMPVPQVKVGPNGQLIIDEQSLVIEQTNAKKSREVLAKEAIIDDDNNGSGFYKRRKKSKEWSNWETLKFYKALNTVGTDFLLMQSVFPNRTRQEIKLKFKKEEKTNRDLIEKALAYHQEFDIEMLEKSLAKFEKSKHEYSEILEKHEQEKQKRQRTKDKKKSKLTYKRQTRIVASSIAETGTSEEEEEEENRDLVLLYDKNTQADNEYQQKLNKANRKVYKKSKEKKASLIEAEDVESLSSYNDFDSDTEIYCVRPTRSGRIPKVKKLQGPDINTLDNENLTYCPNNQELAVSLEDNTRATENIIFNNINLDSEIYHTDSLKTVIPNISDVEPGSLVILSKESVEDPGKSVLQVYMVSSDINSQELGKSNITPVNISPELLATVTAKLSDVESVSVKECK